MRRLTREDVRIMVAIGLTVTRPYKRRALGLDHQGILDQVTDDIVQRIMGKPESEAVILVPDAVGGPHTPRPGRWNEDEPHPFATGEP